MLTDRQTGGPGLLWARNGGLAHQAQPQPAAHPQTQWPLVFFNTLRQLWRSKLPSGIKRIHLQLFGLIYSAIFYPFPQLIMYLLR